MDIYNKIIEIQNFHNNCNNFILNYLLKYDFFIIFPYLFLITLIKIHILPYYKFKVINLKILIHYIKVIFNLHFFFLSSIYFLNMS